MTKLVGDRSSQLGGFEGAENFFRDKNTRAESTYDREDRKVVFDPIRRQLETVDDVV